MEILKIKEEDRPQSYWIHADPLAELLAGISGKARRAMIRDYWNAGQLDQLDPALLQDELDEERRERLGQISPYFMGGEFLPKRLPGESTIARIELETTTHDVIELRARPLSSGKIGLRWVDEYDSEFTHEGYPSEIDQPLSFDELTAFIEASYCGEIPLPLGYNQMNCEPGGLHDAEGLREFAVLESEFYCELTEWFNGKVSEWIDGQQSEKGKDN